MASFKADAEGTLAVVPATFAAACTKKSPSAASSVGSMTSDGFSVSEMTVSEMGDQ